MSELSPAERLILALDVPDGKKAKRLVKELDGLVSFFKVGLELFTATRMDVVRWLVDRDKEILFDIKWLDIPETVAAVVRVASWLRVSFATIDGNGNGEMMRAAVRARDAAVAAGGSHVRLLCLTALTSWDNAVLKEMGWRTSIEKLVEARVRRAIESGLDGVIASGREVKRIRTLARQLGKDNLLIVTPGMRLPGSSPDDHRRACDPTSSIRDGADYIVVGRPIRNTKNAKYRKIEAERYIDAIREGYAQRQAAAIKRGHPVRQAVGL